jgi:two-component system CheB/CheR fusion protein
VHDSAVANHLFRIAQEAVTNAVRHGQAPTIQISLRLDEHSLTLSIEDDGTGMAPSAPPSCGSGLRIMKYRSKLIGGMLNIRPNEKGGTRVSCTISRKGGGVET